MSERTSLRQRVEDAAISLLFPLHASNEAGYVRTLLPYNGEVSGITREHADFQRVTQGQLPAMLVTTDNGSIQKKTMGRTGEDVFELIIVLASCNLRRAEARHRGTGATSDPGIYLMLEDIRDRLWMRPLNADGACFARPVGDQTVLRSSDRNIWTSTFMVRGDATFPAISTEARDLLGIDSTINFPAGEAEDDAINPVLTFDNELTS